MSATCLVFAGASLSPLPFFNPTTAEHVPRATFDRGCPPSQPLRSPSSRIPPHGAHILALRISACLDGLVSAAVVALRLSQALRQLYRCPTATRAKRIVLYSRPTPRARTQPHPRLPPLPSTPPPPTTPAHQHHLPPAVPTPVPQSHLHQVPSWRGD